MKVRGTLLGLYMVIITVLPGILIFSCLYPDDCCEMVCTDISCDPVDENTSGTCPVNICIGNCQIYLQPESVALPYCFTVDYNSLVTPQNEGSYNRYLSSCWHPPELRG